MRGRLHERSSWWRANFPELPPGPNCLNHSKELPWRALRQPRVPVCRVLAWVMVASKDRPSRMHARDAKTRRVLQAARIAIVCVEPRLHDSFKPGACSSPLLLQLLHACARTARGSCADARLVPLRKYWLPIRAERGGPAFEALCCFLTPPPTIGSTARTRSTAGCSP